MNIPITAEVKNAANEPSKNSSQASASQPDGSNQLSTRANGQLSTTSVENDPNANIKKAQLEADAGRNMPRYAVDIVGASCEVGGEQCIRSRTM